MSSTLKEVVSPALATLLSTEMNGLASNSLALSTAAFNNSAGSGLSSTSGDGYPEGLLQLTLAAPAAAFAANTGIDVWFLPSLDGGASYEDGSSSLQPARPPDMIIPVEAAASAQKITLRCTLPPTLFKTLVKNDSTGQALASSGNSLQLLVVSYQQV